MASDPSFTADDFRNRAAKHERAADKLVSGPERDAHIVAAMSNRAAADAKDKAARSSAKCDIFESTMEDAVAAGKSAPQLYSECRGLGLTEVQIRQAATNLARTRNLINISEDDPDVKISNIFE